MKVIKAIYNFLVGDMIILIGISIAVVEQYAKEFQCLMISTNSTSIGPKHALVEVRYTSAIQRSA